MACSQQPGWKCYSKFMRHSSGLISQILKARTGKNKIFPNNLAWSKGQEYLQEYKNIRHPASQNVQHTIRNYQASHPSTMRRNVSKSELN